MTVLGLIQSPQHLHVHVKRKSVYWFVRGTKPVIDRWLCNLHCLCSHRPRRFMFTSHVTATTVYAIFTCVRWLYHQPTARVNRTRNTCSELANKRVDFPAFWTLMWYYDDFRNQLPAWAVPSFAQTGHRSGRNSGAGYQPGAPNVIIIYCVPLTTQ